MSAVLGFDLTGPPAPWASIGLTIADVDGVPTAWVAGVRLRWVESGSDGSGTGRIVGWSLAGVPESADGRPPSIDGLATEYEDSSAMPPDPAHPLGVTGFDHVVVMTSSLDRTCGAIEAATGAPLKRVREAGAVRQGFHRLGAVIVEVVESDRVTSDRSSFWGFVLVVDDLFAVCERLGPDVIGLPKQAVQPGRYIATVRNDVGLGLPVALMTP
jgi:hypothetical protein